MCILCIYISFVSICILYACFLAFVCMICPHIHVSIVDLTYSHNPNVDMFVTFIIAIGSRFAHIADRKGTLPL